MFKFVVFGVFLANAVVKDSYGQPVTTVDDLSPEILSPPQNNSNDVVTLPMGDPHKNGQCNFYASHQTFYFGEASGGERVIRLANNDFGKVLNDDYIVNKGIGAAHKLHLHKLSWNNARKVCHEEGGHLAVIRSQPEEKIVLQIMSDESITTAWIGYHNKFEAGEWVSVLDEPFDEISRARWSKRYNPNPSGGSTECSQLLDDGGLDDYDCNHEQEFICKVPVPVET